uniref:Uncharacterized protein n=1 Tax=Leersia perrieri TaxID=77586 RepID=A0A0D9VPT9_9ORYZ
MSPRPGPKAIDPPDFGKLPAVDDGERVLSFYGGGGEVAAVTGGGGRTAAVEARIGGGRRLVREQQSWTMAKADDIRIEILLRLLGSGKYSWFYSATTTINNNPFIAVALATHLVIKSCLAFHFKSSYCQLHFRPMIFGLVFAFKLERGSCGIQKLHGPL